MYTKYPLLLTYEMVVVMNWSKVNDIHRGRCGSKPSYVCPSS